VVILVDEAADLVAAADLADGRSCCWPVESGGRSSRARCVWGAKTRCAPREMHELQEDAGFRTHKRFVPRTACALHGLADFVIAERFTSFPMGSRRPRALSV
jgi:hypothetical protein